MFRSLVLNKKKTTRLADILPGTMATDIFTTLPNDLLDHIFADVNREDLQNLIKTHRSFQRSAQRLLFARIKVPAQSALTYLGYRSSHESEGKKLARRDLNLMPPIMLPVSEAQILPEHKQKKGYEEVMARQRSCALFLQAITSAPHLADYVRHAEVDCEWGAPLFVNTQAYTILEKLPNLRSVGVVVRERLVGPAWDTLQHVCMQQLWDMLKDLQIETIILKTPTEKALGKLVQIPTVQSFVVDIGASWSIKRGIESLSPQRHDPHTWLEPVFVSNLKHFNSEWLEMSPIAMGRVLGHAKNLQTLRIVMDHVTANSYPVHGGPGSNIADGTFTVLDVMKANPHCVSSLTELTLQEPLSANFTHPDSQLSNGIIQYPNPIITIDADFSFLKNLQSLYITSSLWYTCAFDLPTDRKNDWAWKKQDRCAARAYNLLPASLRKLEIQFMWPGAIFATGEGLHGQFALTPQAHQLKGFRWISEFAQQKQRKEGVLPALECLKLVEIRCRRSKDVSVSHQLSRYSPPEPIREEFEDAGIELVILLC
jgi:hypothetical protein